MVDQVSSLRCLAFSWKVRTQTFPNVKPQKTTCRHPWARWFWYLAMWIFIGSIVTFNTIPWFGPMSHSHLNPRHKITCMSGHIGLDPESPGSLHSRRTMFNGSHTASHRHNTHCAPLWQPPYLTTQTQLTPIQNQVCSGLIRTTQLLTVTWVIKTIFNHLVDHILEQTWTVNTPFTMHLLIVLYLYVVRLTHVLMHCNSSPHTRGQKS